MDQAFQVNGHTRIDNRLGGFPNLPAGAPNELVEVNVRGLKSAGKKKTSTRTIDEETRWVGR